MDDPLGKKLLSLNCTQVKSEKAAYNEDHQYFQRLLWRMNVENMFSHKIESSETNLKEKKHS
jgi:hypothetical protein